MVVGGHGGGLWVLRVSPDGEDQPWTHDGTVVVETRVEFPKSAFRERQSQSLTVSPVR